MNIVKIACSDKNCFPQRQHSSDAGYDLFAAEECFIAPGKFKMVDVGFKMELPPGCEAQIRPRSGLAFKHGITVLNSPGTIDSGYRGDIKVIIINHGKLCFKINKYDRIAQMVIQRLPEIMMMKRELNDSERGEGGIGSTGR